MVATLLAFVPSGENKKQEKGSQSPRGISSSSAWHRDVVCVRQLSTILAGLPRKSASIKDRFVSGLGFRSPFILTWCVRAEAWRGGLFTSWWQEEEKREREDGANIPVSLSKEPSLPPKTVTRPQLPE